MVNPQKVRHSMPARDQFRSLLLAFLEDPGVLKALFTSKAFSAPCCRLCAALKGQLPHVETILDVGANVGQFALAAARHYPEATIYSFEPLPDIFEELKANTADNHKIRPLNWAIGSYTGKISINQNLYSRLSSCLEINETNDNPRYSENKTIPVTVDIFKLNDLKNIIAISEPALLKLDVQGMEAEVLRGGAHLLSQIDYILCETAMVELYKGQPLFKDIHELLTRLGYELVAPLYINKARSGKIIEVDVLYQRSGHSESPL